MPTPPLQRRQQTEKPFDEHEEAALRRLAINEDYQTIIVQGQSAASSASLRQAVIEANKPAGTRCDARVVELLREYDSLKTQATHVSQSLSTIERARQNKEAAAKGEPKPPIKPL